MNQEKTLKITCFILCNNYGRFLSQAIENFLNQKPGNYELEVLVIDDGSTDETPEVCAVFHCSPVPIVSQKIRARKDNVS